MARRVWLTQHLLLGLFRRGWDYHGNSRGQYSDSSNGANLREIGSGGDIPIRIKGVVPFSMNRAPH